MGSMMNRGWKVRALCMGMIVVGPASIASAGTLRVPGEFPSIQAAIDAAGDGDRVVVADGLYTGAGNVDLDFGGKSITVKSANGPGGCVIDCNGSAENPHRGFVFQSGETAEAVVEGFTITRGATENGAVDDRFNGGAILVTNFSSPTIRNMVLTGNSAACWGAAICCTRFSHPTILDCTIIGNASGDDGGALFAWDGSEPTVINSVLAQNSADVTGGGVTLFGGHATLINCTIADNTAPWGAGVLDTQNETTLVNCIVTGNTGNQQIWGAPSVTYSNVEGGFAGEGNIHAPPRFLDATGGNYRLMFGSACVDAGNNGAVPEDVQLDLDGRPRFLDDPNTPDTGIGTAPIVDMGAFEFGNGVPCAGGERIARARCRMDGASHSLVVKLKGGTPGDGFAVRLGGGRTEYGTLNDRGAGTARFPSVFSDKRTVDAQWACGANDSATYVCN